ARGGVLLGFGTAPAFAEWPAQAPSDFVLEGRFRLDPERHVAAHLCLRVRSVPGQPGTFEALHLRNHFRMGVLLSRTRFSLGSDERPPTLFTEPMHDRWLPLRHSTWYTFRVTVVGPQLDYRLDGEWGLSAVDH